MIAYGIQTNMEGVGGRPAWQWLFIIEGSIALAIGLALLLLAPNFPDSVETHWLFNKDELDIAMQRFQCKQSGLIIQSCTWLTSEQLTMQVTRLFD